MASTIPSATAWRARSALVQCVRCSPSATGSRQASSTIWARWRGGNLLRAPQAGVVQQEFGQPAPLVAPADAPDGGPIALQPGGDRADTLPAGDGQDDAGMLHLEPTQAATASARIGRSASGMVNGVGLRPRMREPPRRACPQHNRCPQFVAGLRSRTTRMFDSSASSIQRFRLQMPNSPCRRKAVKDVPSSFSVT